MQKSTRSKIQGHAAGKAPRPAKGTPTDGDLYCLHVERQEHEKRTGDPEVLFAFQATCVGSMRKMLKAGYLAPALGRPRGHWVLTGQGLLAYEGWKERHAGLYGIAPGYGRAAGSTRAKPAVRKPLRKGTLVYHGTSSAEDFDMLEGPAWVSDSYAVAKEFIGWAGGEGPPRILTFELTASPSLALLQSSRDVESLAVWLGERFGLGEGVGGSIKDLANDLCAAGRRVGIDGWHIPNNYPSGSDTMLCDPERFLKLVSFELAGASFGRTRRRK